MAMRIEEWQKIEELLDAALELAPDERQKFLDERAADAPELRREVESLLACEEGAKGFLGAPAIAFSADFFDEPDGEDERAGQIVGNYRIIREIGRGGMGTVFLAERADGEFQQKVALKIVRRSFADTELARRFRRERQILASLSHDNIARLLDGGVSGDGEPFLVMEYVEGLRIDDYCKTNQLRLVGRLRLFLDVCRGVSYAHQHLVVHRDIKPSNIIVDGEGEPKLLDFGIAKLLDAEHAGEHTQTNFRAFTPEYAAPEQVAGGQVTTASDVYSLGVLLNDLLHAAPPSSNPQPASGGWQSEGARRKTAETNLPTKQENANGRANGKAKNRDRKIIDGELKNIIAMARREEPARRYASVAQLAEDIQRYLDGLPVRAQKDSFTYRAEKFVRRNKLGVVAAALVLLSLVAGLAAALWQANVARTERDRAERRFNDVRKLSNSLLFEIAPQIERLEGSTEARASLVKRALEYLDSLARESGRDAGLQSELAAAYEKVGDLQGMPRRANLGDFNGALASYEKAREIRQGLLARSPNDFELRKRLAANLSALAFIRWWLSDVSGALVDSEKSLDIYERLIAERPGETELRLSAAETQLDRADMFYFNDQVAETYPPLKAAIAALETLRRTNPEHVETLRLLARGRTILALTLRFDDRQKEGEVELSEAFAIREALIRKYPHDAVQKQGLLQTYQQGAQFYQEVDDPRAFEILLKAQTVAEESVAADAANTQARQNLAKNYSLLGLLAVRLKRLDEAVGYLEKSAAGFAELEKIEPQNRTYKHDIGRVLMFLGQADYERRNFAGAIESYGKASALFEDDVRADPKNIFPLRKLASVRTYIGDSHRDLARALSGQNRQTHLQAAKENHRRALDIFLQLQSLNALTEEDRKYLEEARANVQKYERP
ncbi:MAG TPA: serine/threonine-protein kinase [Pyrinomonadaceae bacterium]|nr:serine/threonine-protein kinase [Pyrinomonadaceae bacterium]